MRHLILRWLITAAALYAATRWVPGLSYTGGWAGLLGVAAVFGVVNALVRPLLTLLTCPLILLTLGLFTLVINALMVQLTGMLSQGLGLGFRVDGFLPAFWGGLVIGLVSFLLTLVLGPDRKAPDRD